MFAITASFLYNKKCYQWRHHFKSSEYEKKNVLEELYRKYQGKTIKDDYGKNSKEFIDFANDMKKSMKINAANMD